MDIVTFLGPRIPLEIKKLFPLLPKISEAHIKQVLGFVIEYLTLQLNETQRTENLDLIEKEDGLFKKYETLRMDVGLDRITMSTLFTGSLYLLKASIRTQPFTKLESLQKDMQELKLPPFIINEIIKTTKTMHSQFETSFLNSRVRSCTLEDLKWRLDVTISTHSLARVLKPSILMEITTSQGDIKTFEISTEKFYELRYNAAKILKEMQDVEKLPILKLTK